MIDSTSADKTGFTVPKPDVIAEQDSFAREVLALHGVEFIFPDFGAVDIAEANVRRRTIVGTRSRYGIPRP